MFEIIAGNRENRHIARQSASWTLDASSSDLALRSDTNENLDSNVEKDEAHDILDVASECIRSLLKISVLIRKATPRDRFAKAIQARDSPFIDLFDINYVADRYPKLGRPDMRWLCERLGRAITKRRQFLRYTREHSSRMAGREEYGHNTSSKDANAQTSGASAPALSAIGTKIGAATLAPTNPSTKACTLDIAKLEALKEDGPDDDDARSYVSAGSSFQGVGGDDTRLQLPLLSEVSGGSPEFECPFCAGILTLARESAWRRHAYQDLRAYICTLGKGECDHTFYGDSRAWLDHELQAHRKQWMCILCQQGPFRTQDRLQAHVRKAHADVLVDVSQLGMLISAGQRAADVIPAVECPFCDEWEESLRAVAPAPEGVAAADIVITVEPKQFRRHVALHMEQLALFAIPRNTSDNNNEEDNNASQAAAASRSTANRRATSSRDASSETDGAWVPDPPLHALRVIRASGSC